MSATTTTAYDLTAEQVQHWLVTPLLAASVVLASGPRIIDTNGSPVRVPKLTGIDAPGWFGESENITSSETSWGHVTLMPESLKSVKMISRFSNELARQSVVAVDSVLSQRMVYEVAAVIDKAFLASDGTVVSGAQTTPVGLLNASGTQALSSVGAISIDNLHDAEGLALGANVNPEALRWLIRPETLVKLRKLKASGTGNYLLEPDPTAAGRYQLLGHPVTVTTHIPTAGSGTVTTSAVLWDPSQVAVARDQTPTVRLFDQTYAATDELAIRVTTRFDIAPLNPQGVIVLRGINL